MVVGACIRHVPFFLPEAGGVSDPGSPFYALRSFGPWDGLSSKSPILLVPPLSGQSPALLRDMVIELAGKHTVCVVDWRNPRFVSLSAGRFDVAASIDCIRSAIAAVQSPVSLIGLCQSVVPVLIAAAQEVSSTSTNAIRHVVLIAGPVDPHANFSGTAAIVRSLPLWTYDACMSTVSWPYPGAGRRVFPAGLRLATLALYAARHGQPFDPLWRKFALDDGANALLTPFVGGYFNTMDLPAEWLLGTLETIYFGSPETIPWNRYRAPLTALFKTKLITIEGGRDDIASAGQTHATHDLCGPAEDHLRARLTIDSAGHFDLFHGRIWRQDVAPAILRFLADEQHPS